MASLMRNRSLTSRPTRTRERYASGNLTNQEFSLLTRLGSQVRLELTVIECPLLAETRLSGVCFHRYGMDRSLRATAF